MSTLQDKLLEILSKSSVQMSTKELQEDVLKLTNSKHRLSTIHRALSALEKFDLVELRKESRWRLTRIPLFLAN